MCLPLLYGRRKAHTPHPRSQAQKQYQDPIMPILLTLNSGSSSIKFSAYDAAPKQNQAIASGQIDGIGDEATLVFKADGNKHISDIGKADHKSGLDAILAALQPILGQRSVTGIGHRIVHGGPNYSDPVLITPGILEDLEKLTPLAPLHQPHNITGIQAAIEAFPDAIQVGCFDTGFHRDHPFVHDTYGLPVHFYDEGIRRYGFHGLSYDYISRHIEKAYPELSGKRITIAHLGNGASICCVKGRKPIAATLGFSTMDGLPMGTRCGQIDPGILLYWLSLGMNQDEITNLLLKESGLKGMSGLSNDMRTLLASDKLQAQRAIDYFVTHIKQEIGSLAAANGGMDALVFTGGIGENAWQIRERVCKGMSFLGLSLDPSANKSNHSLISDGPTPILVIKTDEESIIARAIREKLTQAQQTSPHS